MLKVKNITLTDKFITELVNSNQWEKSRIVHKGYSDKRKSSQVRIDPSFLLDELKEWGVDSLPSNALVLKYSKGDKFEKHNDTGSSHTDRVYTVVLQLSNPDEYKGGEFIIHNSNFTLSKDKGTLIMFDSNKMHEVTPVTEGVRYSIVMWLTENMISRKLNII